MSLRDLTSHAESDPRSIGKQIYILECLKMSRNTGIDGNVLINAVKHRANYKPIIFCSISLAAIGMLMVVLGMVIMMIDHVELGPPHYDSQYERYEGSNLAHITGKFPGCDLNDQ